MNSIVGLFSIGFGIFAAYKYYKKDASEKSKKETALIVVGVIFLSLAALL